jgi:hypothetical protein
VIIGILLRLWLKSSGVAAAEITRVRASYSAEIERLTKDITELREAVDKLNARVDEERELRRQAEDKAAAALRQPGGLDAQ